MPTITTKARTSTEPPPLVFVSYSHKDESFLERLEVHLSVLRREGVEIWVDRTMVPGDELDPTIRKALKRADIFLALASPDYLHSNYCYEKEYLFALRKAQRKKVRVVVAVARHCQWKHTRMGHYLALPKDGKAIEDFARRSQAYEQIVEGIRQALKRVAADKMGGRAAAPSEAVSRARSPAPRVKGLSKRTVRLSTKVGTSQKAAPSRAKKVKPVATRKRVARPRKPASPRT